MEVVPGIGDAAAPGERPATSTTWCAKSPVGHRPRPAHRRGRRSTRTTGRPSASRSSRTARAKFGNVHRREHRPPARRSCSTSASYSAPVIEGRIDRRGPDLRQLHAAGSRRPVADAALGRAAGVADLSRRAHRRAHPRPRLDPRRRHRLARSGLGLVVVVHAGVLQAVGHQRDRRDGDQPARAARR